MPRIKRKFTGPLNEPIKINVLPIKGETAEAFARRVSTDFGDQALAKVPLLAREFLPSLKLFDPENPYQAVLAYQILAADLAQRLGVRGFQVANPPKRHPFLVCNALENIEANKALDRAAGRPVRSDLAILAPGAAVSRGRL